MLDFIRIYLNDRGYTLPPGSTVRDAIRTAAPDLLPACEAGDAVITDGRGIALGLGTPLGSGDIVRAARSSRRATSAPMDDPGGE